MRKALGVSRLTLIGGMRDRVFLTLIIISFISFVLIVPLISSMSMRQVREVSIGLSLTIISFISLVLTIFLGVNLIYRDIDRRFAHFSLSMPVGRTEYIMGRFVGLCAITGAGLLILSIFSTAGITISSMITQSGGLIPWEDFVAALFLEFLSLVIIASITTLFSTFSTNVFLPLFASIGFYLVGNSIQTVSEYIRTSYGAKLPASSVFISKIAYYILPNLTAFDIKFNATYAIPVSFGYLLSVSGYGLIYTVIILCLTIILFKKREMP